VTGAYGYGAIFDWKTYSQALTPALITDPNAVYKIKSTPVHRGGYSDFSARRYSMFNYQSNSATTKAVLAICASAYKSHWDSEDPDQAIKKFLAGEWEYLMYDISATVDASRALYDSWDGQAQTLKLFGDPKP
jgi:hypothetical protein